MHECKPYTRPSNYMGLTWEGWHTSGFGRSRDSDALEESNFQVAKKELLKFAEDAPRNEVSTEVLEQLNDCLSVQIVCESHWAVGWIEWIAIHNSNTAAISKANELCKRANDYPILDEEHFGNLEQTQANEIWANCYNNLERIKYIREHRSQFEFHDFKDLLGCVRGKYFAGYASELLN